MPAKSKSQQQLFGLALAVKRGEYPKSKVNQTILNIVKDMSEKDIEDFASTKHKKLPNRVKKESLCKIIDRLIKEMKLKDLKDNKLYNLISQGGKYMAKSIDKVDGEIEVSKGEDKWIDKRLKETKSNNEPVPNTSKKVYDYLYNNLRNVNNNEIIKKLNKLRSRWTDKDFDNVLSSGACEAWNTDINKVLYKKGMKGKSYKGTPKDEDLPIHYITIVNGIIFDFVVAQFWSYGLGDKINDENRVTFTKNEYKDIFDSYDWKAI